MKMPTMFTQRTVLVAACLALVIGVAGVRPVAAQEVDVSRLGPQAGDRLPDFSKRDQNGDEHTLSSIMGPNGAIFVLSRSADW